LNELITNITIWERTMQLNVKEASIIELYAYKIILLKQINENNRLIKEIDKKIIKEKENAQTKN
jgi:hypothetical protein